jgi:hypothetical protein
MLAHRQWHGAGIKKDFDVWLSKGHKGSIVAQSLDQKCENFIYQFFSTPVSHYNRPVARRRQKLITINQLTNNVRKIQLHKGILEYIVLAHLPWHGAGIKKDFDVRLSKEHKGNV